MAAVVAAAATLTAPISILRAPQDTSSTTRKRFSANGGVRKLGLHGGLKSQNKLMAMGACPSTELQFGEMRARCNARSGLSRGGAAASTCDVASEILTIIPVMSGLVLVGIALGFVLLRIEAAVEEAE